MSAESQPTLPALRCMAMHTLCELLAHLSIQFACVAASNNQLVPDLFEAWEQCSSACCSFVVWRALGQHEARHQEQLPTASMRGAQLPPSTAAATGSLHSGACTASCCLQPAQPQSTGAGCDVPAAHSRIVRRHAHH